MFLNVPVRILGMNAEERAEIGQRIRDARTAAGLTKQSVADSAKVTTTTLRRMEQGLRVHDSKLVSVMRAVGLASNLPKTPDDRPASDWADLVFVLPPEVEHGYTDTVRFVQAVGDHAPHLRPRATRLMLDAAQLFAEVGDYLLSIEEGGGDGHAEQPRGAAPIDGEDIDVDND